MALAVKLRCGSWDQLAALLERDLRRGALFLRGDRPPAVGTELSIELALPSGSVVHLRGRASQPMNGGVEVLLAAVPQSVLWVIESALRAAGKPGPAGEPLVADEAPAAQAEDELVVALERELAAMRGMNPFQVLGIAYDADDAAVRAAFGELSKRVHPDRFARYESERARLAAAEIFILVREAYGRLATAASRAAARPKPAAPPLDRASRVAAAVDEGLAALAAGDRDRAAARFEAALELDPLHERAARELAAIRRAATEARKGTLSKLLGRTR